MNFRDAGGKVRNWGRWGTSDCLGTLNYITPERRASAGRLITTGKLTELGLMVQAQGIQPAGGVRSNPIHMMTITALDNVSQDEGVIVNDDSIFMPLQSVTQWDGLAHFGYDGHLYNGVPTDSVSTLGGSSVLSIHKIAAAGIAGRGVLLDIAAMKGIPRLDSAYPITISDLVAAERRQGVTVESGDILLVRTGWLQHFLVDQSPRNYWAGEPGLHASCAVWLHERQVAAVASDNWGVEVSNESAATWPLHNIAIRDMGMTLGEIFNLEELALDCCQDGKWAFFFAAPPLKVRGGVGTPITPLVIK